jgi:hypothetical protein
MSARLAGRVELLLLLACVVTCAFTLISVRELGTQIRSGSLRAATIESEYTDPRGVDHRIRTSFAPADGYQEALVKHADQLEAIKTTFGEDQ